MTDKKTTHPAHHYARYLRDVILPMGVIVWLAFATPLVVRHYKPVPDIPPVDEVCKTPDHEEIPSAALHVAAEVIRKNEGLRLQVYTDPGGHKSIGYGHLLPDNDTLQHINPAQADCLLQRDLITAAEAVYRDVTGDLTIGQAAALIDFVFNVGAEAFKESTLLRELNAGNIDAVPGELRRWVHSGHRVLHGLQLRRETEVKMWEGTY